jgi:glycosyltransferase involved in cell wall biosynthesis
LKTVSIAIPCRNEERYIIRCLESIAAQVDVENVEVFVCDGKSTDSTPQLVKEYSLSHPQVHLLINEKQSTPFALNLGIKASVSDVVIILGAHSELYPDYVANCIKAFDVDPAIGCAGGIIENVYENETAEVIGKAMSSGFGVGNAHFRTGNKDGFVDTVAFGAYKKEVFEKIGYFDEELIRNQDDEFNYRVIKAGFKIYLARNIRSKYYVRASFEKLYKQYFQYGYWKVYVGMKHRAVTTLRQLIPLFFVLFLVLGLALSFVHLIFLLIYISVLCTYIVAALIAALSRSNGLKQPPRIVYAFLILHISYGFGYLKGIVDFFILRKRIKKEEVLTR